MCILEGRLGTFKARVGKLYIEREEFRQPCAYLREDWERLRQEWENCIWNEKSSGNDVHN
jgi:hypothetical protein